jgi:hypothetical protein
MALFVGASRKQPVRIRRGPPLLTRAARLSWHGWHCVEDVQDSLLLSGVDRAAADDNLFHRIPAPPASCCINQRVPICTGRDSPTFRMTKQAARSLAQTAINGNAFRPCRPCAIGSSCPSPVAERWFVRSGFRDVTDLRYQRYDFARNSTISYAKLLRL